MFYNDEMSGFDRQLFESGESGDGFYAEEGGEEEEDEGGLGLMEGLVRDGFFESAEALCVAGRRLFLV